MEKVISINCIEHYADEKTREDNVTLRVFDSVKDEPDGQHVQLDLEVEPGVIVSGEFMCGNVNLDVVKAYVKERLAGHLLTQARTAAAASVAAAADAATQPAPEPAHVEG